MGTQYDSPRENIAVNIFYGGKERGKMIEIVGGPVNDPCEIAWLRDTLTWIIDENLLGH